MSHPLTLTPEVHATVVTMLASGATLETAAQAAGVPRSTFALWRTRGLAADRARDAGDPVGRAELPFLKLLDDARIAQAKAEVAALAVIQRAAREGSFQAACWYLERAHPEMWAARRRTNGGAGGRPQGAVSAPDRKADLAEPPKIRLVK